MRAFPHFDEFKEVSAKTKEKYSPVSRCFPVSKCMEIVFQYETHLFAELNEQFNGMLVVVFKIFK